MFSWHREDLETGQERQGDIVDFEKEPENDFEEEPDKLKWYLVLVEMKIGNIQISNIKKNWVSSNDICPIVTLKIEEEIWNCEEEKTVEMIFGQRAQLQEN